MSEHVGYVIKVENLRPHPNADRLQILHVFGCDTCVSLDVKIGDLGIYFPIDLQLSEEYCDINHLCRKTASGEPDTGYLERNKRNIRAMKLRGEQSEGLFMPLESLKYTGETKFEVGNKIDVINGHEICRKYIPKGNAHTPGPRNGNHTRKRSVPIAPLFAEHADTEQLAYNLDAFRGGDLVEITLKMHGTSGRTGYLPKFQGYKRTFWDKILRRPGTPIYDWGYVTGTRRVVLNDFEDGGFYGSNAFREPHAKFFEGKLNKGETVYYEIVGFTTDGAPIMASVANSKISDKEFTKQYGKETVFSYGCDPKGTPAMINGAGETVCEASPQSACYVYRMTMTNEDGDVVEYTPDFMRYRCEQMGAKCVSLLWRGIIPENEKDRSDGLWYQKGQPNQWLNLRSPGEWIEEKAEEYYDGPDPIGKTHVREGVVVRIVNRPKFCAYKHKNWSFKVLEGIAKDLAAEPDMEEAQDAIESDS